MPDGLRLTARSQRPAADGLSSQGCDSSPSTARPNIHRPARPSRASKARGTPRTPSSSRHSTCEPPPAVGRTSISAQPTTRPPRLTSRRQPGRAIPRRPPYDDLHAVVERHRPHPGTRHEHRARPTRRQRDDPDPRQRHHIGMPLPQREPPPRLVGAQGGVPAHKKESHVIDRMHSSRRRGVSRTVVAVR